jgi:hypothetical protein
MIKKIVYSLCAAALLLPLGGCKNDYLDLTSSVVVNQSSMFTSTTTAMMAVNGLGRMMHDDLYDGTAAHCGYETWMVWMNVLGDNLVFTYTGAQFNVQANWKMHRVVTYTGLSYHYILFYRFISNATAILNHIDAASGTESEKDNIKGQAYAYRAFAYFNLVQAWGKRYDYDNPSNNDEPNSGVILRNTDELTFDNRPRSTVDSCYMQINSDIDNAIKYLKASQEVRTDKTYINLYVAEGLKARILLAQGKWAEAAAMAKDVVDNSGAKLEDDTYTTTTNRMMDHNNTEWLWCKIGNTDEVNHTLKNFESFMTNMNVSYNVKSPRAIYNQLYNKISATDVRKTLWFPEAQDPKSTPRPVIPPKGIIVNYMANKFIVSDPAAKVADVAYMRLPEMMLIEAEGYARAGQDANAAAALYPLAHARDPQYKLSTKTGQALIDEIMFQRSIELWGEGFRWLDLKRLNMPLDRGPAVRTNLGYSDAPWQAISASSTKSTMPVNFDPEASNFDMYQDGTTIDQSTRNIPAGDKRWQFLFPDNETDVNPLCVQNEL